MASYKSTVIVILAIVAGSAACERLSPNYCADVPDHNCMDREVSQPADAMASPMDAPPMDAPPEMNTSCASDTECIHMTPVCGIDHRCRICTVNSECPSDACLPDGACADESNVAYVQAGTNGSCTRAAPCGTLQAGLGKNLPYVRVSGSLGIGNTITIGKGITILGDTGSELVFTINNQGPALKINVSNKEVVVSNFRITEIPGTFPGPGDMDHGVDSAQILGMNPIVTFIHVSIDGGSGNGISTSDNDASNPAMNPNITLTDVTIRQKGNNGIQTTGGQLTVKQSSIFSNGGNGIYITSGNITISQSSILNNVLHGIDCKDFTSDNKANYNDSLNMIIGNLNFQINNCR